MKRIFLLLLTVCFSFADFSFSETVVLKTGQVIVGELVEKTDEYIKINYNGVVLTYYKDEITEVPIDTAPMPADSGVIRIIRKREKKNDKFYDDACLRNIKSRPASEYERCQCRLFPELETIQKQYGVGVKPMALEDSVGGVQECAAYLYWLNENKPQDKDDCKKKKGEISKNIRDKKLSFFIMRGGLSCE